MKKTLMILAASFFSAGCASLTKTQIESVNQFAQTTKDFSSFPSKIMTELADIRLKRGLYFANSLSDSKLHIADLDSTFSQKNFDYEQSKKVDVTFKIIDKYAQSLLLLSSDKHVQDIEQQAKNFGVEIDSLIALNNSIAGAAKVPSGIGGAVSQLIVTGGKQYVKVKQAREIKKFVTRADTLIGVMTSNLLEHLQSANINALIAGEERGIYSNYKSFLDHTPKAMIDNERDYMELKNSIHGVRKLQKQSIEATRDLRKTHKKLLEAIKKRNNLKECIAELQELGEGVNELKETVLNIETVKKR